MQPNVCTRKGILKTNILIFLFYIQVRLANYKLSNWQGEIEIPYMTKWRSELNLLIIIS